MTMRPAGNSRIIMASIVIGAAIVASCAAGLLGWKVRHDGSILAAQQARAAQERAESERDHQARELREEAQAAALAVTVTLTSIDPDNIDEYFAKILEKSTGGFKDEFGRASTQMRQLLVDNHASATGKVVASAVQSDTLDQPDKKVVLLLMVDQSVSNDQRPEPRIERSRMKMTMELVDGRWLASKLEYL